MFPTRIRAALVGALLLGACEKAAVQDITGADPGARVRFFNFGVNAPAVNFYANDTKMTAITSATGAEATTGVGYGSAGASGYYAAIAPGSYAFTGKIAAAVDKDVAVSRVTATVADGKHYSFYMSGFYDAAGKIVEGFVVEDPLPPTIDYGSATVRFVHAISNGAPMTLYAKNPTTGQEVAVGASIAYKVAGAFTVLPGGVYDLSTRFQGASSAAIARTAVSLSAGRVYTITARGDMTVTSATATNRPFLDNSANR